MVKSEIFKAYDIRGIYPEEINEEIVYKIAQSYAKFLNFPKKVVLGKDVRLSSPLLWQAAANGLVDAGADVYDIGTCTTDMYYFAVANYGFDGGIMVSASHNPKEYNGLKMVREKSIPISIDSGLEDIRKLFLSNFSYKSEKEGEIKKIDIVDDYIKKVASFINPKKIKKFKIVANANFGMAGKMVEKLEKIIPMELIKLNFEPDGNFPKGKPDPLIPENREEISRKVLENKADFGVAWDADADRCFFIDSLGRFIEGCYMSAILTKIMLSRSPKGSKIISDPRLRWPIESIVSQEGGELIYCKSGHSFIKEKMRAKDAVFGGENSAHYYFKDYFYCDNGLIPFLLILDYLSKSDKGLSELNDYYLENFPVSGEINIALKEDVDSKEIINKLEKKYSDGQKDKIDGLSISYYDWRFNLRASNTEPLIRLNIEAKNKELIQEKKKELLGLIKEI